MQGSEIKEMSKAQSVKRQVPDNRIVEYILKVNTWDSLLNFC